MSYQHILILGPHSSFKMGCFNFEAQISQNSLGFAGFTVKYSHDVQQGWPKYGSGVQCGIQTNFFCHTFRVILALFDSLINLHNYLMQNLTF